MNSLDTNLLLYAANVECDEHEAARQLVQQAAASPRDWIVADQVYFELYRLVRSPAVLENPLKASDAWNLIDYYRHRTGWQHCAYESSFMDDAASILGDEGFAARRTFDLVLALTLRRHGVRTLYTRNVTDFEALAWFHVVDPLAASSGA